MTTSHLNSPDHTKLQTNTIETHIIVSCKKGRYLFAAYVNFVQG